MGILWTTSLMAQMGKNLPAMQETWVWSLGREIPWRREWLPIPVFLPGEFHWQKSLAGYSPWGHTESDTTERLTHTHMNSFILVHLKTKRTWWDFKKNVNYQNLNWQSNISHDKKYQAHTVLPKLQRKNNTNNTFHKTEEMEKLLRPFYEVT